MTTQSNLPRWERYAEWPLAIPALLFLGVYSVLVLVRPHGREAHVLWVVSWIVWGFVHRGLRGAALPRLQPVALVCAAPAGLCDRGAATRLTAPLVLIEALQKAIGNAFRGRIVVYTVSGVLLLIYTSSLAVFDKERFLPGATINSGRIIAILLMIGGISLVGVVTAALASWIIERVSEEEIVSQTATAAHIEELRGEILELSEELRGQANGDHRA
jgi:voltage-gated potassium channel